LRSLRVLIPTTVVLALAVGVGVATGAIPDASGVIHGCYDPQGALRVIDPASSSCKNNETALNWSQTGPAGPTGPNGPKGATGPTGPSGSALGYAYVLQDGSLINSKGVVLVTHPSTGLWCFALAFTPHVAVATVTGTAGVGNQIIHTSISPGASDACHSPNPADAAAFMVLPDGSRTDYQFFIEFN
jgi:hypothetical protein